jgi:hypothetical protein
MFVNVHFLKRCLIVDISQINDSYRLTFNESFTKFEAVLTHQNDCSEDNARFEQELTKEASSNDGFTLERFEQETTDDHHRQHFQYQHELREITWPQCTVRTITSETYQTILPFSRKLHSFVFSSSFSESSAE